MAAVAALLSLCFGALPPCPSGAGAQCTRELARGPGLPVRIAVSPDDKFAAVAGVFSGLHVYNVSAPASSTPPSPPAPAPGGCTASTLSGYKCQEEVSQGMQPVGVVHYSLSADKTQVMLAFEASVTGYAAMGIGTGMLNAQMVMGYVDGQATVRTFVNPSSKTSSAMLAAEITPASATWVSDSSVVEANGKTTTSFTYNIAQGGMITDTSAASLVVSTSSSDGVAYHNVGRTPFTLNLDLGLLDGPTAASTDAALPVPSYSDARDVVFSRDAKNVAVALAGSGIAVVSLSSGTELWSDSSKGWCVSVAYSPDGTRVASGHDDGKIYIWDAATGALVMSLPGGHAGWVYALEYTIDGGRLVSGSEDHKVVVWDATTGAVLKALRDHTSSVYSIQVSALYIASMGTSSGDAVHIYRLSDYAIHKKITKSAMPRVLSFSKDGRKLVLVGDGDMEVYSVHTGSPLETYTMPYPWTYAVSYFRTSDTIITAEGRISDAGILLWDEAAPIPAAPPGASLPSCHADWGPLCRAQLAGQGDVPGVAFRIAVSHDDKFIAVTASSGLHVYNLSAGAPLTVPQYGSAVDASFSPYANNVAAALNSGGVAVLSLSSGRELWSNNSSDWCYSVAYSPDGTHLASGHKDGTIYIWEAETGALVMSLTGHRIHRVFSLTYTPDGGKLISGSGDHTMTVWDATTGAVLSTLTDGLEALIQVQVSPDGVYFANAGTRDSHDTVNIYKLSDYSFHKRIAKGIERIGLIAFSQDWSKVAVTNTSGGVHVYSVETDSLLQSHTPSPDMTSVHALSYFHTSDTIITAESRGDTSLFAGIHLWDDVAPPAPEPSLSPCPSDWGPMCRAEVATGLTSISSIAVSHDDTLAAVGGWEVLHVYNIATGATLKVPPYTRVNGVAFSRDAKNLAVALNDAVAVVSLSSGTELWRSSSQGWCDSVTYSPDGTRFASGHGDGDIHIWDAETSALVLSITERHSNEEEHGQQAATLTYTPDGEKLISSGAWDNKVIVWNAKTGAMIKMLTDPVESVADVQVSPDGLYFAIVGGSASDTLNIYNLDDYSLHKKIPIQMQMSFFGRDMTFSQDWNKVAVTGGTWDIVNVYSVETATLLQSHTTSPRDLKWVGALAYLHTSDTIITADKGSLTTSILLWDDVAPLS